MASFRIIICVLGLIIFLTNIEAKFKRSMDLSVSSALLIDTRLPMEIVPTSYELHLQPIIEDEFFTGTIKMNLNWKNASNQIALHAHYDLNILSHKIKLRKYIEKRKDISDLYESIPILRSYRLPKKTIYLIYLKNKMEKGSECELVIEFEGTIFGGVEGLLRGQYLNSYTDTTNSFLATNLWPNNARRVFPCFDEPGFKVPFTVSISRPKGYTTISNTALVETQELSSPKGYVMDIFKTTPVMSTFSFGFVTCKLKRFVSKIDSQNKNFDIHIWSNNIDENILDMLSAKLHKVYYAIEKYLNTTMPLQKIDVIAIPELPTIKSVNSWGLLLFRENKLLDCGYYTLAQELLTQWFGYWVTPFWWNDAQINKAMINFIAAEIVFDIDYGREFDGKYPMTILYSIYYEFSKRYPNSRITGMKQEMSYFKTELVLRMFNYTLSSRTFRNSVRNFIVNKQFDTFFIEEFWSILTKQALKDRTLESKHNVSEIASSWILQNRLPVVSVNRDYLKKTAKVSQKMYLRERPHNVPDQDKMLWYVPLILNRQDKLNFSNTTPYVWMENKREILLKDLPDENKFIIINQEDIAPFPVNYDEKNWQLLSTFLQTDIGRNSIPIYSRAKLLHDAWNLAYAGDLSFVIALNMTLFLRSDRSHIVWNPFFTFIDQIGRHIDISLVHRKFEKYVGVLLMPLSEELSQNENKEFWNTDLYSLTNKFLCDVGYKPCLKKAREIFDQWKSASSAEDINLLPKEYLCSVLKWGSDKEWDITFSRFMTFPVSKQRNERTFLLKSLAGCPKQHKVINKLLNVTLLNDDNNLTETDMILILNSLEKISSGNLILLNYLSNNWITIRSKFQKRTNLWDSLLSSATKGFKTQEGYDMVNNFKIKYSGEFGSASHIVDTSLRNIKEESKWSNGNLPAIEKWLDMFLFNNDDQLSKLME